MDETKAYSATAATSPLAGTTIPLRGPNEHDVQIEISFAASRAVSQRVPLWNRSRKCSFWIEATPRDQRFEHARASRNPNGPNRYISRAARVRHHVLYKADHKLKWL